MDVLDRLLVFLGPLIAPYSDLFDQRDPLTYAGAALFALLLALLRPGRRGGTSRRLRAFWRLLSRRSIWLHRSSLLDYKLYGISMIFIAYFAGFFIVGTGFWADAGGAALTTLFGPPAQAPAVSGLITAVIILTNLVAVDFGYWLGHFAMHKSELLWEFHKVHHSAEVMTPATEFRQHPVEFVLIPCTMALTTGLALAVMTHVVGKGAPAFGQVGFSLIILAHLFTFQHLRHSHLRIAFTGIWGKLLHSPMHHHLHHSANRAHHDTNMGYMLSVWDWMAGTLIVPTGREKLTLGIGTEGHQHDSVRAALLLPFLKIGAMRAPELSEPRGRH
jgi:sterol desaturase/sphingolipid hydroxylase (fatty acid hydroxylase superfamily)